MNDARIFAHTQALSPRHAPLRRARLFGGLMVVLLTLGLAGCGGGASTEPNPVTTIPPDPDYNGPPPATADVQAFRINLWDNVKSSSRCGGCHIAAGQTPMFARTDDVNLAYQEANGVVELSSPVDSQLVTKVGGGHNCWLTDNQACADIMTTWITNWAGELAGGGRQIQLTAPPIKDPGASKNFPADPSLYASTVYPLATLYCQGCHDSASVTQQSPFFADNDLNAAYDAVKAKINLDDPANSRLVLRLRDEFHNCWNDCQANATEMENAIISMADQITPTQVPSNFVTSKALTLFDGTIASGGNRYENAQIGLWEFKTGLGTVAFDTSGVDPAINLNFSGNVAWFGGWGIDLKGGKAQGTTTSSKKLHDMIKSTGEYSIEVWAAPGNVSQEDARIVSYSAGTTARNFTLGQTLYNYDFLNRSGVTNGNGDPALSTAAADEDLQATLQHVVVTFDPVNGRRIYVNGVFTDDVDASGGGTLTDWDDTFAFVLGNEVSSDRPWQGVIRLAAIHNRVLSDAQIQQNFDAGVGEKFFLLFSVTDLLSIPDSYIMFEVSQYDTYSYLFHTPTFIILGTAQPGTIPVKAMRIGVNGAEAPVGQAYAKLDESVTDALYTPNGQPLSRLGTVVALEKGPGSDEFFLTFEQLGNNFDVRTPPIVIPSPPPPDGTPMPDIGLRVFDEINATMAEVTQVSPMQNDVNTTYNTVKQQLPTVEAIDGFLSAHQIGIAQLSIEYCNALVEDTTLRASYFPGFNFGASPSVAFATPTDRDLILDPLFDNMVGTGLTTQPAVADFKGELNSLIDNLIACGGSCAPDRTEVVVKAVCAAAVGNATTLVH